MDRLADVQMSENARDDAIDGRRTRPPVEWMIVLAVLLARVVYLTRFSSWELVGDEAHYWEWSRRPDWSYYTKGPGIAWAIWLSTRLVGTSVAAIRLPAAIASALMTLAGARVARDVTGGDARAAAYAAIALCLAPGLFATAQLATTDVFYAAMWTIAAGELWHAVRADATPARRTLAWAAVGAAIGVGALFKYTALLELVGIAAFLVVARRRIAFDRAMAVGASVAIILLLVACSPMIWWNAHHGWPTVAHQIGRLRLPGGDESVDWAWSPRWFPTFVAAQLGLVGGVGAALIVLSARRVRQPTNAPPTARAMLVWLAVPILVFYGLLSVFRETQGNWAIAAYPTLLVLVGIDAADATRAGAARPAYRSLWHWYLGIGAAAAIVLLVGPGIARVPGLNRLDAMRRLQSRISGSADRAAAVNQLLASAGRPAFVVAKGYQEASLLAFYLPGRPTVFCAASRLGARPDAYDYFADTDLAAPMLRGDDAILVGGDLDRWRAAFRFGSIDAAVDVPKAFVARDYEGPAEPSKPAEPSAATTRPRDGRTP